MVVRVTMPAGFWSSKESSPVGNPYRLALGSIGLLPPTWNWNSYMCSSSRSKASKIASCSLASVWSPRI